MNNYGMSQAQNTVSFIHTKLNSSEEKLQDQKLTPEYRMMYVNLYYLTLISGDSDI